MKFVLKNTLIALVTMAFAISSTQAQKIESPYVTDGLKDGLWIGAGVVGSGVGLYLISQKEGITEARLQEILNDRENINGIDRWAAGNFSESANGLSDIPFYASFAFPFALLIDDHTNDHGWQMLALYVEALSTTGAMYSITASFVNRSRPYVYTDEREMGKRLSSNGQRSFYSGHAGATATATFFTAKVLTDFHPDMKGKGFIWGTAAALPAAVSYLRIQAGRHFLTDVVLGYALGAATGILVPQAHKKKDSKLSLIPTSKTTIFGDSYSSLSLIYQF